MSPYIIPAQSAAWEPPPGRPRWIRSILSLETPVPYGPHTGLPHMVVSSLKTRTRFYLKHSGPRLKFVELIWAQPHRCSDLDTFWGSSKSQHVTFKRPSRHVCQLLCELGEKSLWNGAEAPGWWQCGHAQSPKTPNAPGNRGTHSLLHEEGKIKQRVFNRDEIRLEGESKEKHILK